MLLMLKKIVIIGPESTGKSTLCQQLAQHYNTLWVPEFAREYLLATGMNYNYEDLITIARGQILSEEEYLQAIDDRWQLTDAGWQMPDQPGSSPLTTQHSTFSIHYPPLLFIDTNMYVMKVWCEFVFGKCHRWILDQIVERKYNLYLLCNIDLPWVKDELREYPDLLHRQQLYNMYKDILINQSVPWAEISGDHDQRFRVAIDSVNKIL